MATLVSPGVDVTITDTSSYSTTGTGTIPLIILGTHEYKTTPSGAIASGTLPTNAGTLYYISSQREAVQTFGNPIFYTKNGTPIDGYELNEYGLHALYETTAYSPCYVIRGGIDYSDLVPTTTEPRGEPANGTIWLNPDSTSWGIYQSNGSSDVTEAWISHPVSPITSIKDLEISVISNVGFSDPDIEITSIVGSLVINNIVFELIETDTLNSIVIKINNMESTSGVSSSVEYINGKYNLKITQEDITKELTIDYDGTSGSSTKTTLVALGLFDDTKQSSKNPDIRPLSTLGNNGDICVNSYYASNIYYQKVLSIIASDPNSTLASGMWYVIGSSDWVNAKANGNSFYSTTSQQIPSSSKSGDIWLNLSPNGGGLNFNVKSYSTGTGSWNSENSETYTSLADMIAKNPSPSEGDIVAISPYVIMDSLIPNTGTQSTIQASVNLLVYDGKKWEQLSYSSTEEEPTTVADVGTLWYNNTFNVDIMVNKGGNQWVGYRNFDSYTKTDSNGPILSASRPKTQSTGSNLADGDLWIDTSDTENYPVIYRYKLAKQLWVLVDNSDQITPAGIVFADARSDDGNGSTDMIDLLTSNFVDPDAPNPELYPEGTLLFNMRIATNNIKEWHPDYFTKEYGAITENGVTTVTDYTTTPYKVGITSFSHLTDGGRWVTISGLYSDGSPKMGRHAQRAVITKSLKAVINSTESLKSETFYYTLITSPGYPELIPDMVQLNDNIKNVAFVIGDTPSRLTPTSSSISSLLNGINKDPEMTLSTSSPYLGVYYPWGKGENVDGTDIIIPPSTIALRTIINSDNLSYPWYPPAGYTRGLVDNASSVGYIDPTTGEYTVTVLNQSQRDLLYQNNINPIAFMPGKGLVVYGQKTRNATTSAMDRINVARLACYLSYKLDQLAKPFLFELNTTSTRANVKSAFDRFLSNIVTLQGITDFAVQCDDGNNTPATIDANELWIDIAIIPTKSIEMIYIPVRIMNTGSSLS